MNNQPTKQPLDHWFNRLRNSAELSEDQVRKIIASGTSQRRRFPIILFILSRRFIIVTVLLSSLIAGAVFIAALDEEVATPQRPSPSWGKAPANKVIPAQQPPPLGNLPRVVPSRQVEQSSVRQLSVPSAKPTVTEPPHILQRQGIVALELTTEELAKIGIQMLPDGGMRLYGGTPNVKVFSRDTIREETFTFIYTLTSDSSSYSFIQEQFAPAGIAWIKYPVIEFYTENGKLYSFRRTEERNSRDLKIVQEEETERGVQDSINYVRFADPEYMKGWIPVNITLRSVSGSRIISLWLPAESIAPYLPDQYRIPVGIELQRLKEIADKQAKEKDTLNKSTIVAYEIFANPEPEPDNNEEEVTDPNLSVIQQHRLMQQARPGEPVMEVWWQSAGAVMVLNITPNPARDATELTFMLDEARIVALDLYRYDGQRVKRLTEGVSLPAGQHQLRADLRGVQPGLYLLGVTTDRGEQALRRLYVMQ